MAKNRLRKHYIFFIFQNLLKRACYSSIMDIPPVPNQPTSFIFPQRSFGKANPLKRSFQASWFSTRAWLHHNKTYKISSASRAKIVPKCIKIVCTDVRKYNIFSGVIPRTPLTRGGIPFSCSPPFRAFGTRKTSLIFHGRTTFRKPTTALLCCRDITPILPTCKILKIYKFLRL